MNKPITLPGFLLADCWPVDLVLKPVTLLVFRLWVAQVFFASGLTKSKYPPAKPGALEYVSRS
ncbi:hypothetical protein VSS37_13355, partial [Candidatus Thiothrix sp. Deng01]|nr:hypothetical protein [Candidatus Thiothrix sp. Deng01]